jgi:hypothetical protein
LVKEEKVVKDGAEILSRPNADDREDPERCTQTYLEQVYANQPFRDAAEFFKSVRYLHIVPQLVREAERSVGKHDDPSGGDFLEQIDRTPERTQKARPRRILGALRSAVPQLSQLVLRREDARGTPPLEGKYEHWRPEGAWQREDQFSDGTLRLMGLLWAALDGSGPLLLEEPELSLHPEFVRFVPETFARIQRRKRRQILVSTHSTDLQRDEGISQDDVLLLLPSAEGTEVRPAGDFREIRALLEEGATMAEAVMPMTRPNAGDSMRWARLYAHCDSRLALGAAVAAGSDHVGQGRGDQAGRQTERGVREQPGIGARGP